MRFLIGILFWAVAAAALYAAHRFWGWSLGFEVFGLLVPLIINGIMIAIEDPFAD